MQSRLKNWTLLKIFFKIEFESVFNPLGLNDVHKEIGANVLSK